jgi:hypothetical protein
MGAWGFGINENDTYADVYDGFYDAYNNGGTPEVASSHVKEIFCEYFSDYEDSNSSWLALAYAQWETKSLDSDVFEIVRSIIESGNDIELWKKLGAKEEDLKKREVVLESYLNEISTERKTKKRRKSPKFDIQFVTLVEASAPDDQKVFTVLEQYRNGDYVHTSGSMSWKNGGGSVFYYTKKEAQISAIWEDSKTLQVTIEKDLEFTKKKDFAFYSGDRVDVKYLCK